MNVLYSKGVECSVNDILSKIDDKLMEMGKKLLNIIKYDLNKSIESEDMYLLVKYRKMLMNKLLWCSDCFTSINKQEISSKILRIIY